MKTESTSLTCFLESLIYITAKCFPSLVTLANLRKVPTAAGPAGSEHPPPLVVLFSLPGSLGRSLPSSHVLPLLPIRFQQATKREKKKTREVLSYKGFNYIWTSGTGGGGIPLWAAFSFSIPLPLSGERKLHTLCCACGKHDESGRLGLNSSFCFSCVQASSYDLKAFMSLKIQISTDKNAWLGISG